MVELEKCSSHWWWFDSPNKGRQLNRSPWLQSTLADLDEKTKKMLKLIDEDADSFAQRAEMYYRKRPELVSMVEQFYRAHRSLAERHDQVKSEPTLSRLSMLWAPPSLTKHHLDKSPCLSDTAYDSYSEACGPEESDESEVDDPEAEEEEISEDWSESAEVKWLKGEIERLRDENKVQKDLLAEKDEEKREVIRQLSLAVESLRDENTKLRKHLLAKKMPEKKGRVERRGSEEGFFQRLFDGFRGSSPANLVAL